MPTIRINGKEYEYKEGETILEVALRNKINIPHLCFHKDLGVKSNCRQCIVEVDGEIKTSCTTIAREGMNIETNTDRVKNYRKMNTELIKARVLTKESIEDENFLRFLEEENLFDPLIEEMPIDYSLSIVRNPNICILCGRCVAACQMQGVNAITYAKRGINTIITPINGSLSSSPCVGCGQCTLVCPTGAVKEREEIQEVLNVLKDKEKYVVVQTAPAVRVSLGELFGLEAGTIVTKKMVGALKELGFDLVIDTVLGADLTTFEEAHELWHRINNNGVLPMMSSCCPAWISFVEKNYPEFISNLSTCKSPHEMLGAIIKSFIARKKGIDPSRIIVVSIMPCTAKKAEARRNELMNDGLRNVDYVLTTRELGKLLKQKGINLKKVEEKEFDSLSITTGAGTIYGATGGVTESVLRTLFWIANSDLERVEFREVRGMDGVREAEINVNNKKLRLCIVHGLRNAAKVLNKVKNKEVHYDFIEVMACPGGCIGGGGQPKSDSSIVRKRAIALYEESKHKKLRRAHENPVVLEIYKEFLEKPLSEKAEIYLHRSYRPEK